MTKEYYYYTVWWLEGDDMVKEGLYHSRWVSPLPPQEFLANVPKTEFIGEYQIKQFKTEKELDDHWAAQTELTPA